MDLSNKAKRAASVGLIAGVATHLYYGGRVGSVSVLGMNVPGSVGVGVACGVGSVAADVAHEYIPFTPIGHVGASAVELGAAGLATSYALEAVGVNRGMTIEGAALGAGALVGGRWVIDYMGGSGGNLF